MPSLPFDDGVLLSTVTRSGRVESWHRGAVAVWHDGDLLLAAGPAQAPVICRSATKPLQALPFLERGLDRTLELTAGEIAVMCASHGGTRAHTDTVRRFLLRGGFAEDDLGCGPHAPFCAETRRELLARGERPTRVHNNCSGKHTGFLHLARACGDDLSGYLDPGSRSQREVAAAVAAMAGVDGVPERGIDGCGAPTFVLPLAALARAFARLANPDGVPAVRAAACRTILAAAGREPELLAGRGRLCTALVRTAPGRVFAKNGAEGVYAAALAPDPQRRRCPGAVGIAVKAHDGSDRGYQPVVVDLLRHLGAFGDGATTVPDDLRGFWQPAVRNTRGDEVGAVRCAVDWGAL
ncbi:MAG: asparaginase [Planctomycetota bacterium]